MKKLIIENCDECPFFIDAWAANCRETCKKIKKDIQYNIETKHYPIPTECILPDETTKID